MKLNLAFEFSTLDEARAVLAQFVNLDSDGVDKIINDAVVMADAEQKEIEDNQSEQVFSEGSRWEWPDTLAASPASEREQVLKRALAKYRDHTNSTEEVVALLRKYGHEKVSDITDPEHFDIIYKDVMARF